MARRGFFAELQHQSRLATRERERAAREAHSRHAAAVREAEQAQRAAERLRGQLDRAAESERKRLEKEAREAHVTAMEATADERNRELEEIYDEIDSLLAATLSVDDYVDLKSLHTKAVHPAFDRTDLEAPTPKPDAISDPDQPLLVLPEPPSGLAKLFGQKKFEAAVDAAKQAHEEALAKWRGACREVADRRRQAEDQRVKQELKRVGSLKAERDRYSAECAARESEAAERNKALEDLIANLGYGTPDAVREYVGIVLANSAYPECFKVAHEFEFDPATAELRLSVTIPAPSDVPEIKAFKYSKGGDEITSSSLSQKECRERYSGAVNQVALRSIHEVFESDRRGLIRTISLEVGTRTVDPATGRPTQVLFVVVAAERDAFSALQLSAVVPALALAGLGASISKNPYALTPVDKSRLKTV